MVRNPHRDRTLDACLALLCAVLLLGACQSTTRVGDRYFEGGRLAEAAAAYQVYLDSNSGDSDRVSLTLYRLGVIFASPGTSVHDPERSIDTLNRLIRDYPENRYATEAVLLRDLQERMLGLDAEVTAGRVQLSDLEIEMAERERELRSLQDRLEEKEARILALQESIPPLRIEISNLIHELAAKQEELEQLERLKAIDLEQLPP